MPRVKITEFKAKELLNQKVETQSQKKTYVVKIDEGIKKRGKQGLIALDVSLSDIDKRKEEFKKLGYNQFLVEEYIPHKPEDEKFIALERTRLGVLCHYSNSGGINIEDTKDFVKETLLTDKSIDEVAEYLGLPNKEIESLLAAFENLYLSFLESNPFIVREGKMILLDLAVEVDSAAEFFVNGKWHQSDFVSDKKGKSKEETEIGNLAERSSASFKFVVLNPEGSIFTILSGGGASIVLADEINNVGKGKELANYAEYSGGPTEDETYIFTKNILSFALKSKAKNKKIYIAGGVANFTDIRATFKGVIKALDEKKDELKAQNIKVFVRRGGPYQEEGLSLMSNFLEKSGLLGEVMGPDRVLTEVITTN